MPVIEFPYIATIISGLLAFGLGVFWYHPKMLGERWMVARGANGGPPKPTFKLLAVSFILWMISACFYSFLVLMLDIDVIEGFFALSCLVWVAFAIPPILMGALYTGYSFDAVSIDAAYHLGGYYIFAFVHILAGLAL